MKIFDFFGPLKIITNVKYKKEIIYLNQESTAIYVSLSKRDEVADDLYYLSSFSDHCFFDARAIILWASSRYYIRRYNQTNDGSRFTNLTKYTRMESLKPVGMEISWTDDGENGNHRHEKYLSDII
jgi:hypothetical protein